MARSQPITAESPPSRKRRKSSSGNTTAPSNTEDVSGRGRGRSDGVEKAEEASKYVAALDSALPPEMLGHLQVNGKPEEMIAVDRGALPCPSDLLLQRRTCLGCSFSWSVVVTHTQHQTVS